MDRREALKLAASLTGGTIVGANAFLAGCTTDTEEPSLFSADDIALLDEIGETILPASGRSPGAKATGIGAFMAMMVTDCYGEEEMSAFREGIEEVKARSRQKYKRGFLKLQAPEKLELLTAFDREAREKPAGEPIHFFTLMKQLTILGYFTSEPGVTQAMRYDPIPGGYDGCQEYREGDKAWYGPLSSIG